MIPETRSKKEPIEATKNAERVGPSGGGGGGPNQRRGRLREATSSAAAAREFEVRRRVVLAAAALATEQMRALAANRAKHAAGPSSNGAQP
ncbi:hypothetical protein Scep_004841 [Stephania cephalantha]|uniref:Uncharacterized protein n=1 Tax=Stephania cephalantha TaxID=152367 RepID=A0AAP0KUX5_9MAGN